MSTLILYMSTHGCTEKAVKLLMTGLHDDTTVVNMNLSPDPDIKAYDRIIIGGSIHMGGIQKEIRKFCERHLETLLNQKVGLFLCCMFDGEVARKQFEDAYPPQLRSHASVTGLFGGEISFSKMNLFERTIVKKVAKIEQDVSNLDPAKIREFARAFAQG